MIVDAGADAAGPGSNAQSGPRSVRPPVARLLLIGGFFLAATLVLGFALRHNTRGTSWDFAVARWLGNAVPGVPTSRTHVHFLSSQISQFGHPPGVIWLAAGACLLLVLARIAVGGVRAIGLVWLSPALALVIAGGLTEYALKRLIDRRLAVNPTVYTYPSGHATSSSAIAVAAMVILLIDRRLAAVVRLGSVVLLAAPFAIAMSMVALGAHAFTDVIGGWLCGTGVALVVVALVTLMERRLTARTQQTAESGLQS